MHRARCPARPVLDHHELPHVMPHRRGFFDAKLTLIRHLYGNDVISRLSEYASQNGVDRRDVIRN